MGMVHQQRPIRCGGILEHRDQLVVLGSSRSRRLGLGRIPRRWQLAQTSRSIRQLELVLELGSIVELVRLRHRDQQLVLRSRQPIVVRLMELIREQLVRSRLVHEHQHVLMAHKQQLVHKE
jgi:hypothetical protein